MPRLPTRISFICEGCQQGATPEQIRKANGHCQVCSVSSWTLLAGYTDTEVGVSPGLSPFGHLAIKVSVDSLTNEVTVPGIAASVAKGLIADPKLVSERVADYVRSCYREELCKQGARPCLACDALFVPGKDKPWAEEGYCSLVCYTRAGKKVKPAGHEEASRPAARPMITVECPNGHKFQVMASYTGCFRTCPQCGKKCAIP